MLAIIHGLYKHIRMTSNTENPEAAARGTLALLETRLRRLEFLLSGASDDQGIPNGIDKPASGSDSLRGRLDVLEAQLAKLKKLTGTPGSVVRNIDRLCRCSCEWV